MLDDLSQEPGPAIGLITGALGFWPYLFIVISVTGLAYMAIDAAR